ncbi:hypothetical protein HOY81_25485 [Streptomyces sp. JJ36]|nr:hypothetical protein [Streptomyces sp. JJ36]
MRLTPAARLVLHHAEAVFAELERAGAALAGHPLAGAPGRRLGGFPGASGRRWTHRRVHQHPDGGIARLRVHGLPHRARPRRTHPPLPRPVTGPGGPRPARPVRPGDRLPGR